MKTADPLEIETKEKAARQIANAHSIIDPEIALVYRVVSDDEDAHDEPIKILEVNNDTVAAGIRPAMVGAHVEGPFYFPIVVIDLTPEEFQQVQTGELTLPSHWRLGDLYFDRAQQQKQAV